MEIEKLIDLLYSENHNQLFCEQEQIPSFISANSSFLEQYERVVSLMEDEEVKQELSFLEEEALCVRVTAQEYAYKRGVKDGLQFLIQIMSIGKN